MSATPNVDPRRILLALREVGQCNTRIGRAVGCDPQTVQCWIFGMPMHAIEEQRWAHRLIEFAVDLGMDLIEDSELLGATCPPAAPEVVTAAFELLIDCARVEHEAERIS